MIPSLRGTILLRRNIYLSIILRVLLRLGINSVFWLWPLMTVDGVATAPANEGAGSGAAGSNARVPEQASLDAKSETEARTLTRVAARTGRDMTLHITTTLSRSWTDLSRFFGRCRDAIAYERWMHASFGWALTPTQRLLPSAAWPAAFANELRWRGGTRGAGPMASADMLGLGLAWWGGVARPTAWPRAGGWTTYPPSPRPGDTTSPGAAHLTALMFAPLLGITAGLQGWTSTMGFGLFG